MWLLGADQRLDMTEFVLLKLQIMGKVDKESVEECRAIFKTMDPNNDGSIDAQDLARYEKMQEEQRKKKQDGK